MTVEQYARQGGVPEDAITRLDEMRERGLATSDLSTDEFLAVRAAGFRPVGFVMGSAIYHLPSPSLEFGNYELDQQTQALASARAAAMQRMESEALVLDADGVVGVRVEHNLRAFGDAAVEFLAVGTAIVADSERPTGFGLRNVDGLPFTSDLSGQAFYKLIEAGYVPVGLLMANCAYHVGRQKALRRIGRLGQATEIREWTEGIYDARELAMGRMQAEATRLGAETVVEVRLSELGHGWGDHMMEFLAIGTGIRSIDRSRKHPVPQPQFVMSLDK